jgi:hypothetical protein
MLLKSSCGKSGSWRIIVNLSLIVSVRRFCREFVPDTAAFDVGKVVIGSSSAVGRFAISCKRYHTPIQRRRSTISLNHQQDPCIQVISDVDDTLKSSGGVNIAGVALGGIDVQYERGCYYPGVAAFMLQLSLGPSERSHPAKVAILTARAEEFKAALELKPNNPLAVLFRQTGERAGILDWGFGPVLYGSVAEWIVQDRKGFRKFTNFERLIQQDPTGDVLNYVYVGDTGELDAEAGETMLREYPHLVQAVFLHVVSGELIQEVIVPAPRIINGRLIIYFRTYVGAAIEAVQFGLMSIEGLRRVIGAACLALESTSRNSDKWVDLQQDIDRAYKMIEGL